MQIIADLQLHSKYSRAVSQKMDLFEIGRWASRKGINVVATGDWTHPLWFRHLKENLKEINPGIYRLKQPSSEQQHDVLFFLSAEISSIYSQGGKVRRVHNLIFSPSLEVCEKVIKALEKEGAHLMSDGRPIVGIPSDELLEMVLEIDKNILFVPAHCLPPHELIETKNGLKRIETINHNDYVLSHTGYYRKVEQTYKRRVNELLYTVTPWYYSQGIQTTGEHPFLAIKTIKKCSCTGDTCIPFGEHLKRCYKKHYKNYKKEWIPANKLEINDFICFPIIRKTLDKEYINHAGLNIRINEDFCLLVGYFLSEGCIDSKGGITFTFSAKETAYSEEVIELMKKVFGITHSRIYRRKNINSIEIIFYSKNVAEFLDKNFYIGNIKRAPYKVIPHWMIFLPIKKQKQILIGWFRGDDGYTLSQQLVSSINKIALRMGIIPNISANKKYSYNQLKSHVYKGRVIKSNFDNYQIKFSYIQDVLKLGEEKEFSRFNAKITRRHGYMDQDYVYLPIRKIDKNIYSGMVYNLEVERDHSYSTWVSTIHNCWTPWFSLFGSKSGFDSIEECFGPENARYIYAIETGLSSDPLMNWQIKELDNRAIISSSDAHSGPKIGREATVFVSNSQEPFDMNSVTYNDIAGAIRQDAGGRLKIGYTIEFFPEEGKYHWSGHRSCNIRYNALEVKEKGEICPVCHNPLTIGVENRVLDLSYKHFEPEDLVFLKNKAGLTFVYDKEKKRKPFVSLIPLLEVLTELNAGSPIKALRSYDDLTSNFATEFDILMRKPYEEIERHGGKQLSAAVEIIRNRNVFVDPGYDGVFGVVKIFNSQHGEEKKEQATTENQQSLF